MGQVTFGKRGWSSPTPNNISSVIDIFTAVCGVLVAWVTSVDFIPNNISNIVASILGLFLALSQAIKPFFGVKHVPDNVPSDQVGAMDTPDTPDK